MIFMQNIVVIFSRNFGFVNLEKKTQINTVFITFIAVQKKWKKKRKSIVPNFHPLEFDTSGVQRFFSQFLSFHDNYNY